MNSAIGRVRMGMHAQVEWLDHLSAIAAVKKIYRLDLEPAPAC